MSDLRTEAGGSRMALDGFACRGLAEGLTSELTLSEERRPAVGSSGGGVFRAEGTAGAALWRMEGIRGAERKPGGSQDSQESGHRGGLGRKMGFILSVMEATGGFKQLSDRNGFMFLEDRTGCCAEGQTDGEERMEAGRLVWRLEGRAGQRRGEWWAESYCPHVQSQPSIKCPESLFRHDYT